MIAKALKYKQFCDCESMELGRKMVSRSVYSTMTLCIIGNAHIRRKVYGTSCFASMF